MAEDGSTVQPGKVVLRIRMGATDSAPAKLSTPKAPETSSSPPSSDTSPQISPTPTSQSVSSLSVSEVKSKTESLQFSGIDVHGGPSRKETRVKMNRMRQRIAQRLKDAQNTYAMLTTFNEIDMR